MNIATLNKLNLAAGVLHGSLGIGLSVWAGVSFDPSANAIDTALYTLTSKDSAVPELFRVAPSSTTSIVVMILLFVFLTSIFHFVIYAIRKRKIKTSLVGDNHNSLRWIEYAITATLMMVILMLSAGMKSFWTLVYVAVTNILCMLMGDLTERYFGKKDLVNVFQTIGWVMLALNYTVLIFTLYQTQDQNDNVPSFVLPLVIAMLVFFGLFGVVQLLYVGNKITYFQSELGYTILSFVSKLILAIVVFNGVIGRQS